MECPLIFYFYFFFPIAFKSMLEFNAMVKGMFPHVKVLFVFPLTHSASTE